MLRIALLGSLRTKGENFHYSKDVILAIYNALYCIVCFIYVLCRINLHVGVTVDV